MKSSYNPYPSEYELKYIIWEGIEYDKEKLIEFVDKYNKLKETSKKKYRKEELRIMDEILEEHDIKNLETIANWLNNVIKLCIWLALWLVYPVLRYFGFIEINNFKSFLFSFSIFTFIMLSVAYAAKVQLGLLLKILL